MKRSRNRGLNVGTCTVCGKQTYNSRAEAKRAGRQIRGLEPGTHLSPYRCEGDSNRWHLGNLPSAVLRGVSGERGGSWVRR